MTDEPIDVGALAARAKVYVTADDLVVDASKAKSVTIIGLEGIKVNASSVKQKENGMNDFWKKVVGLVVGGVCAALFILFLVAVALPMGVNAFASGGTDEAGTAADGNVTDVADMGSRNDGHIHGHGSNQRCEIPGSVFVAEVGSCILHVTDPAEIAKATPPVTRNDSRCAGKPSGFRYDTPVVGPHGMRGIAHHVCGTRS